MMWRELVSVLRRILSVYEEVVELSERKRRALRSVAVKEFEEIVRREQALVKEIDKLENERKLLLQKIAGKEKAAAESLTAAIAISEGTTRRELKELQDKLRSAAARLAANNRENNALTRQSLELIGYKINLLAETKVEPTYAGSGQENVTAAKWLDYKA